MVEASSGLRKAQQDLLLDMLQKKFRIFLSYDIPKEGGEETLSQMPGDFSQGGEVDRFFNKDHNFSITWYSSTGEFYNKLSAERLEAMKSLQGKSKRQRAMHQARELLKSPCFVIAHELFDALPIHQFHLNQRREWCEKVVALNQDTNDLEFTITDGPTDNTMVKLKPDQFFSKEAKKDLRPGDSIELCPEASTVM